MIASGGQQAESSSKTRSSSSQHRLHHKKLLLPMRANGDAVLLLLTTTGLAAVTLFLWITSASVAQFFFWSSSSSSSDSLPPPPPQVRFLKEPSSSSSSSNVVNSHLPSGVQLPSMPLKSQQQQKKKPFWSGYTFRDINKHLNCHSILSQERPILSPETWSMLRQTYHRIVGPEHSSIAPLALETTGFCVQVVAQQSPGMGRGVFANQFIAQGSLVWTTRQTAQFATGDAYREFLFSIPADLACDAIDWTYVHQQADHQLMVSVDLDEGCLMNNGKRHSNIGCKGSVKDTVGAGCMDNEYYALRDIQEGEELLLDYQTLNFVGDGYQSFGLSSRHK